MSQYLPIGWQNMKRIVKDKSSERNAIPLLQFNREKFNISIGQVHKLIPSLNNKENASFITETSNYT